MQSALETFVERGRVYGDNYDQMGEVLHALFPQGVALDDPNVHSRFHLMMMIVVKVVRLAQSGISHQDSAHDIIVYAAMLEAMIDAG